MPGPPNRTHARSDPCTSPGASVAVSGADIFGLVVGFGFIFLGLSTATARRAPVTATAPDCARSGILALMLFRLGSRWRLGVTAVEPDAVTLNHRTLKRTVVPNLRIRDCAMTAASWATCGRFAMNLITTGSFSWSVCIPKAHRPP